MGNKPFTLSDLTVGCEVECFMPAALNIKRDSHDGRKAEFNGWYSTKDSSLQEDKYTGFRPYEFVSPIFNVRTDKNKIHAFITDLKSRGGKCDQSCGGHVHIGVQLAYERMTTIQWYGFLTRLIMNFAAVESVLFTYTGNNRRNNQYCRSVKSVAQDISEKRFIFGSNGFHDRYSALNLQALLEHRTVEFRIFAGTVDPEVWINNIRIASKIVLLTLQGKTIPEIDQNDLNTLQEIFGITITLPAYRFHSESYWESMKDFVTRSSTKAYAKKNHSKIVGITMFTQIYKALRNGFRRNLISSEQFEYCAIRLKALFRNATFVQFSSRNDGVLLVVLTDSSVYQLSKIGYLECNSVSGNSSLNFSQYLPDDKYLADYLR